jgi:hypothetical protein
MGMPPGRYHSRLENGIGMAMATPCGLTGVVAAWPGTSLEADTMKRLFAAALLGGFCATPVLAQATKIGDWTIEKRSQDTHCNASRGYKDANDQDRQYGIVLSFSDKTIVFVIIYEGWEWDTTGEVLRGDFTTDDDDIYKASKWEVMDKTSVRGVFEYDQSILEKLKSATKFYLDFANDEDDSIELETPKAGEVLGALKFCEDNRK